MRGMRRSGPFALVMLAVLPLLAAGPGGDRVVLSGDVRVPNGETAGEVVVFNGDVTVGGLGRGAAGDPGLAAADRAVRARLVRQPAAHRRRHGGDARRTAVRAGTAPRVRVRLLPRVHVGDLDRRPVAPLGAAEPVPGLPPGV